MVTGTKLCPGGDRHQTLNTVDLSPPRHLCYTETMEPWIQSLSETLFWDVDKNNINPSTHTRWLLERVLERGQWEDWILVRSNIDRQKMLDE